MSEDSGRLHDRKCQKNNNKKTTGIELLLVGVTSTFISKTAGTLVLRSNERRYDTARTPSA